MEEEDQKKKKKEIKRASPSLILLKTLSLIYNPLINTSSILAILSIQMLSPSRSPWSVVSSHKFVFDNALVGSITNAPIILHFLPLKRKKKKKSLNYYVEQILGFPSKLLFGCVEQNKVHVFKKRRRRGGCIFFLFKFVDT